MNIKEPKHLYHYCSFENFKNIIISQTLRLSDLSKSNDPREDKIILEVIKMVARKMNISSDIPINFLEKSRRKTKILGICFTENENCSYFYDMYCKGGGVSISFNYAKLKDFFNKISVYNDCCLNLKKVIYKICCITNQFEANFQEIINKEGSVLNCGSYLFLNDNFYKDKIWEVENEYRAGFRVIFPEEILNGDEPLNNQFCNLMPSVKYDGEKHFVIPLIDRSYFYIELPLEMSLIEKIFVPLKYKSMFKETVDIIKFANEEKSNFDFEQFSKKIKYI